MKHPFTDEELVLILEFAHYAMLDDETYNTVADDMDIADEVLKPIQEKLDKFLNT